MVFMAFPWYKTSEKLETLENAKRKCFFIFCFAIFAVVLLQIIILTLHDIWIIIYEYGIGFFDGHFGGESRVLQLRGSIGRLLYSNPCEPLVLWIPNGYGKNSYAKWSECFFYGPWILIKSTNNSEYTKKIVFTLIFKH